MVTSSDPDPGTQGFSQALGLNDLITGSPPTFTVRADILTSPSKLSLALPDLSGAVGTTPVILKGDTRGADALGSAGSSVVDFNAAGNAPAGLQSLNEYFTSYGADLARQADAAASRKNDQAAVAQEATARRSSVEGVNLDEELMNLTTYQQAYNASARVMQAAGELYDVLMSIVK